MFTKGNLYKWSVQTVWLKNVILMYSMNFVIKFLYLPDFILHSNNYKTRNSIGSRNHTQNCILVERFIPGISFWSNVSFPEFYSGWTFHTHRFLKHSVLFVNSINGSKQTLQVLVLQEQVYSFFNSSFVLLLAIKL